VRPQVESIGHARAGLYVGRMADDMPGMLPVGRVTAASYADAPVWNERRDICLLFTGSFPRSGENGRLRAGTSFPRVTELLAICMEEHGPDFFRRLTGPFKRCRDRPARRRSCCQMTRFGPGGISA